MASSPAPQRLRRYATFVCEARSARGVSIALRYLREWQLAAPTRNMGRVGRTISMTRVFADRVEAGRALAQSLLAYRGATDAIVLALPRGGVPVGFEVAQALGLPLDVLVVRKLGLPWQPELAMGAIASGGALVAERGRAALRGRTRSGPRAGAASGAGGARAARTAIPRCAAATRDGWPHRDPGRRRARDRCHHGGGRARAAWTRRDARRRRGAGRVPGGARVASPRLPTRSCASRRRCSSVRSGSGTATSARHPMPRSASCSPRPDDASGAER